MIGFVTSLSARPGFRIARGLLQATSGVAVLRDRFDRCSTWNSPAPAVDRSNETS